MPPAKPDCRPAALRDHSHYSMANRFRSCLKGVEVLKTTLPSLRSENSLRSPQTSLCAYLRSIDSAFQGRYPNPIDPGEIPPVGWDARPNPIDTAAKFHLWVGGSSSILLTYCQIRGAILDPRHMQWPTRPPAARHAMTLAISLPAVALSRLDGVTSNGNRRRCATTERVGQS